MNTQFVDLSVPDIYETFYCSPNTRSREFTHLMKLVLMAGNTDALNLIKEIVKNNPKELNKQNEKGWSALMIASRNSATYSSAEIVKLLLEAGSNPNLQNNDGYTALMLTSNYSATDSTETVRILLATGCDPNLQDKRGYTALMIACASCDNNGSIEIINLLLDAGCDFTLRTRFFLQNDNNLTALHFLLKYGNLEKGTNCLERLIMLSQKDIMGDTSFYDLYLARNVNVLDEQFVRILKGEAAINNTKSARQ